MTAIHLISKETVEEKIRDMQESKRELFDQLMNGQDVAAGLATEEILELLRPVA